MSAYATPTHRSIFGHLVELVDSRCDEFGIAFDLGQVFDLAELVIVQLRHPAPSETYRAIAAANTMPPHAYVRMYVLACIRKRVCACESARACVP